MAEKWLQNAAQSMKSRGTEGSFTAYCKKAGFGGVTCPCIAQARKAGGALAKKANFAANATGKCK